MTDEPGKDLTPRVPPPPPIDPEQLRQFEEFQRFQEFQRNQQAQGGTPPAPPPPPPPAYKKKPLWLILLGSKLFRRLAYLVVLFFLALWAYNHYFGGDEAGDIAIDSGGAAGNLIAPTAPAGLQGTVGVFYKHVAHGSDTKACELFVRDDAKGKFAAAFGAPDCPAAVRQLKQKVTAVSDYEQPQFPPDMLKAPVGNTVTIDSCQLIINGGPRLGTFTLIRQVNNTWVINGYASSNCG